MKSYKRRALSAYRRVRRSVPRGRGTGFAVLAVLGVGLYYLIKKGASAAQLPAVTTVTPSVSPISPTLITANQGLVVPASGSWDTLTGSTAPTTAEVAASGSFWQNLTYLGVGVLGYSGAYVNFPSGSQAAASLLPFAADSTGNLYTQWSGTVYVVNTVPDSNGNFNATSVG